MDQAGISVRINYCCFSFTAAMIAKMFLMLVSMLLQLLKVLLLLLLFPFFYLTGKIYVFEPKLPIRFFKTDPVLDRPSRSLAIKLFQITCYQRYNKVSK